VQYIPINQIDRPRRKATTPFGFLPQAINTGGKGDSDWGAFEITCLFRRAGGSIGLERPRDARKRVRFSRLAKFADFSMGGSLFLLSRGYPGKSPLLLQVS